MLLFKNKHEKINDEFDTIYCNNISNQNVYQNVFSSRAYIINAFIGIKKMILLVAFITCCISIKMFLFH